MAAGSPTPSLSQLQPPWHRRLSPEDRWPRAAWAKAGAGAFLKEPNKDAIKLTAWALRPYEPLTGQGHTEGPVLRGLHILQPSWMGSTLLPPPSLLQLHP